jgi:probable O-glycosylation ligase (exosortase A-associated)
VLRSIFVIIGLVVGSSFAVTSAVYAAAFYLWIAYFRPESWAWSGMFASWNLSYLAGVFLVIRALISGTALRLNWRTLLLLLFLVLSLVSTWHGLHAGHSWGYWQAFAKTIVVSYLLTTIIKTETDLRLIFMVIALSLGFEAAKQGWAQLILSPGGRNDNSIPFLGDNNVVAVGMAMLVPLVSALAATSSLWWVKRGLQFLNIGIVYRGLSTYSRGGFLSLGAVGALWFWRSQHKLKAVVTGALVAALVLPTMPPEFWSRMSTITASSEERDDSQSGRLHFWRVAIAMANDRPWTGVGHYGYEPAFNDYDFSEGRYGRNRSVHSAWFGALAEIGYPGLIVFVLVVLFSLKTCGRVRRMSARGELPDSLGQYGTALQSSLLAFIVGGSFVPMQYSEMVWHFMALTIALDRVAVTEAEALRVKRHAVEASREPTTAQEVTEDFVWA